MTRILVPRLVAADARAGVPAAFGVMTTGAGVLLALAMPDSSSGWSDALNSALVLLLYTGPLALAAAAVHTASIGRKGLYGLAATTARGTWAPARLAAASSLSWAWVALVVQTAVLLLKQQPVGGFAPASLMLPLSAASLTTMFSLIGSAVGSRLTGVLAAPVVTLLAFGWMLATAAVNQDHPAWSPVFNGVWFQPNQQPNSALVGGQVLVAIALALASMALLASRRPGRVVALLLGTSLAITGGALLGQAGSSPVSYVRLTAPVCGDRAGISLCVWPQLDDRLDITLDVLGRVTDELAPFLPVPRAFAQTGLPMPDRAPITVLADDRAELATARAVDAVLPHCEGDRRASRDLKEWAMVRLGAWPADEETEVARVVTSSVEQQHAWVDAQRRAMDC